MGLETATYIDDLVAANPTSNDPKSQGDDHLRLIKAVLQATFPAIAGAVTASHLELSFVDGVTSAIQGQLDLKAPLASPVFTGVPTSPTPANGDNSTKIATTEFVVAAALSGTLPGQTGNAGKLLSTDGADADWYSTIDSAVVTLLTGGNIVGTTALQSLDNKTLSSPVLQDITNNTKKANIILSGVTAGQNRNITLEDKNVLWKTPGWVYLSTVTASNSATVDLETTIDSTYDTYAIVMEGVQGVAGAATLNARLKSGGSYASGAGDYSYTRNELSATNTVVSSFTGASQIPLITVVHNSSPAGADTGLCGIVFLHAPNTSAARKRVTWEIFGFKDDVANDPPVKADGVGHFITVGTTITGIRFLLSTGNLVVGSFTLFGLRKT